MTYLLDTNSCVEFLNHRDSAVTRKLSEMNREDVALCSVAKAELYIGAYKSSRRDDNLGVLRHFFSQFASFPFDDRAAEIYGRIRVQLAGGGKLIGPNDLLIAAIAMANDMVLVTHNTREFSRVVGLRIEDWEV